jgi:TonB C terminal
VNNDKKKVDVVDWQDIPPLIVTRAGSPSRCFSPASIGVIGTLLIHALILPSAYFGSYGTKVQPPQIQQSRAFAKEKSDSEESLVLIVLPSKANTSEDLDQSIASALDLREILATSPIHVDPLVPLNVEILTLGEERSSQTSIAGGDGAERARLFGIYSGQIKARIDRIWRRPRTPVAENGGEAPPNSDESFQCEAQIVQDRSGKVQEILLPRCNGSLAWQLSLVTAIREASPLPAPPSASVFSRSIALNFVGLAYAPGAPDDGYEIAPRQSATAAYPMASAAPKSNVAE